MAVSFYDAESGVDGATVTASAFPATTVSVGASSYFRYDSTAALTGRLGYHHYALSGQNSFARIDLTSSKVQAFRGNFRLISAGVPTNRRVVTFRNAGGTVVFLDLTASSQLRLNTTGGTVGNGPTLTPGTDYDASLVVTVGASTNDGQATFKVYNKNTGTQVGSTVSTSTFNFGTTPLLTADVGSDESAAVDVEYAWDLLRFANDQGEFSAPVSASASLALVDTLSAGAVVVPYVSNGLLDLEG